MSATFLFLYSSGGGKPCLLKSAMGAVSVMAAALALGSVLVVQCQEAFIESRLLRAGR